MDADHTETRLQFVGVGHNRATQGDERNGTRSAASILVVGMGVVTVAKVIALSLDPGNYFHHWPQQAPPFVWPGTHVLFASTLVAAYTLVLLAALTATKLAPAWLRWMVAFLLLIAWGTYVSRFLLHFPMYWLFHLGYLWATTAVALVGCLVSVVLRLWSAAVRLRQGRLACGQRSTSKVRLMNDYRKMLAKHFCPHCGSRVRANRESLVDFLAQYLIISLLAVILLIPVGVIGAIWPIIRLGSWSELTWIASLLLVWLLLAPLLLRHRRYRCSGCGTLSTFDEVRSDGWSFP